VGLEDSGEHTEGGCFACSVCAEQTVNLAWMGSERDLVDGTHFAAFLVLKALGQITSFNHWHTPPEN